MPLQPESLADIFIKHLKIGVSGKLQCAEPKRALESLEHAYKIARRHGSSEPILKEYRRIAAYRLGHLTLQMAGGLSDREAERAQLERALELFEDAAQGKDNHFGPMPWIAQLPVLRRLQELSGDTASSPSYGDRIQTALTKAVDLAGGLARAPRKEVRHERHLSLARVDSAALLPVAQGPVINMIELAAYFLGVSFAGIRGLRDREGDPCEGLVRGNSFVLVGHTAHQGAASLRLPEGTVDRILDQEAKKGAYHLVFKLNAPGSGGVAIRHPEADGAFPKTFDPLHLIAIVVAGGATGSAEELRTQLVDWKVRSGIDEGGGDPQNQLDQAIFQARKSLARLFSPAEAQAIGQTITGTPKSGLAIAPGLRVLAALDVSLWGHEPGWLLRDG